MFGVDGNNETRAGKASAEMRAQALAAVAAGNDRRETIMTEENSGAGLAGGWHWLVFSRPTYPGDHRLLQASDRLALKPCRLLALEIGLGCRDAGVVQK